MADQKKIVSPYGAAIRVLLAPDPPKAARSKAAPGAASRAEDERAPAASPTPKARPASVAETAPEAKSEPVPEPKPETESMRVVPPGSTAQPKPVAEVSETPDAAPAPMLRVENLSISFRTDEGLITPVQGVSFDVHAGKTLGLVGESGSGKSISTKALMRLLPGNSSLSDDCRMHYTAKDGSLFKIEELSPNSRAVRQLRGGEIGMIFQEPMASFSPVYTIGNQMMEAIRLHKPLNRRQARELAVEMLDKVGISNASARVDQFPHEMSGGMRQRAMIALALSAGPALLIADEPTTALDVTIQAQVLELMEELQRDLGMGMIFITHDLGVIAQIADEVAVMYLGTIVERGPTHDVIRDPKHPYTQGLLEAIPSLTSLHDRLSPVPGDIPSPNERPSGCPFQPRCSQAISGVCDAKAPAEITPAPGRAVRCWLHQEDERNAA